MVLRCLNCHTVRAHRAWVQERNTRVPMATSISGLVAGYLLVSLRRKQTPQSATRSKSITDRSRHQRRRTDCGSRWAAAGIGGLGHRHPSRPGRTKRKRAGKARNRTKLQEIGFFFNKWILHLHFPMSCKRMNTNVIDNLAFRPMRLSS